MASEVRISEIIAGFTERQRLAFKRTFTHRFILYGGARGGGKSRFVRWFLLLFLLYQFLQEGRRNVRVGLFCETYPDLRDRQISKIRVEFPGWLGTLKETAADGLGFFLREEFGGGVIALRNLDVPEKYQSAEFAAMGVDELTKITKDTFDKLRGSLRWPGIRHTVFLGATNPGGVGHAWVKQLWIDRDFPVEMRGQAEQYSFVQSLPSDNPYLDEQYWQDLNTLPDSLRRAWVYGEWSVFEGQAFAGWRSDRHVIQTASLPIYWPKWRAVDWGFVNPFCCLWLAKSPDTGRIYSYRELYATGLTDREQARTIRELTPPDEQISINYADPSMWERKNSNGMIFSTADEYAAEGVVLTRADNDRLSGKRKVDRLLQDLGDGAPGLVVMDVCRNLIRTLPALPYDKTHSEDVDSRAEDHAYDALRYGLTNYRAQQGARERRVERSPLARVGL